MFIYFTVVSICCSKSPFTGIPNPAASLCPHHQSVLAILLQSILLLRNSPSIFFALNDHLITSPIFLTNNTIFGPSIFWMICNPYAASS